MTDFDLWLKRNMLSQITKIITNTCQQMYADAYIHSKKTNTVNNFFQTVDQEYAVHYITEITNNLQQQMLQLITNNKFHLDSRKHKGIIQIHTPPSPITREIIPHPKYTNTLLDTALSTKLFNTFKHFKFPFKLIFLDIETDSLNIKTANILQISLLKIETDEKSLTPFTIQDICTTYVKPYDGYKINTNDPSFKINQISQEHIDNAPYFEKIAADIADETVLATVVGFNIHNFDIPILERHLLQAKEKTGWAHTIDIGQAYWKNNPSNLTNALKTFNIKKKLSMHNAADDNIACIHLLEALIRNQQIPHNPAGFISLLNSQENVNRNNSIIKRNNPSHTWVSSKNWADIYKTYETQSSNTYKKRHINSEVDTPYKKPRL